MNDGGRIWCLRDVYVSLNADSFKYEWSPVLGCQKIPMRHLMMNVNQIYLGMKRVIEAYLVIK